MGNYIAKPIIKGKTRLCARFGSTENTPLFHHLPSGIEGQGNIYKENVTY